MCLAEIIFAPLTYVSDSDQHEPIKNSVNGASRKYTKSVKFAEPLVNETIEIPKIEDNEKENFFYSKQDIKRFKDEHGRISLKINTNRYSLVLSFKKRRSCYLTPANNTSLLSKLQHNLPFQRKPTSKSSACAA